MFKLFIEAMREEGFSRVEMFICGLLPLTVVIIGAAIEVLF